MMPLQYALVTSLVKCYVYLIPAISMAENVRLLPPSWNLDIKVFLILIVVSFLSSRQERSFIMAVRLYKTNIAQLVYKTVQCDFNKGACLFLSSGSTEPRPWPQISLTCPVSEPTRLASVLKPVGRLIWINRSLKEAVPQRQYTSLAPSYMSPNAMGGGSSALWPLDPGAGKGFFQIMDLGYWIPEVEITKKKIP